mmetsp:Transcript_7591/g.17832  ORF Transcript_7591/g.17832 Transcript_7591/m.17832 type:complete len:743 (-) Transcript_7591:95-2323(-)
MAVPGAQRRRVIMVVSTALVVAAMVSALMHGGRPASSALLQNGAGAALDRRAALAGAGQATMLAEGAPKEEGKKEEGKKEESGEHKEEGKEGEEGEGSSEEELEEMAIKARWGFAFVTIIIIFSVAFVKGSEFVKHAVPEELEEVVAALMEELTTLGFLGFAFFITTMDLGSGESLIEQASVYALNEPEALKELFEGLHYLVFFISLSFILCTVGGLWNFQYGPGGNKAWAIYEEHGVDVAVGEKKEMLAIERSALNAHGRLATEWAKDDATSQAEYLRIRTRFILNSETPRLDADFDFHKYLQRRVGEVFSSLIEVHWKDWLVTWLLLLLFWSVVQEGMIMEKLLLLYALFMLMIMAFCLLLQAKVVWVKNQLLPRVPDEMRESYAAQTSTRGAVLCPPVAEDQRMMQGASNVWEGYFDKAMELIQVHKRPGNKHERLFWFGSWGPEIMLHMIRLSLLWTIISLALLLSHHLPGIIQLGQALTGLRLIGYLLFFFVAAWHIVAMLVVFTTARVYTVCTSIEMLKDVHLIEKIVREQKYDKCSKAIEMLFTLNYYLEQAQMLEKTAAGKEGATSPREAQQAMFVPETPEEQKALDDLEELFNAYDADGSGELSPQEVKELLQTMGTNLDDEELTKLIRVMDADGSGEISLMELAAVMLNKKKLNGAQTKLSDVGKQLFDMFDKEGDGTINVQEMVDCFSKMGKNWDMEQVHMFFDLIDQDGSGEVDRAEFMDFCQELESMRK